MLTRIQFLATRWALDCGPTNHIPKCGHIHEAWAQAIHPAQRAIAAAKAEKAG